MRWTLTPRCAISNTIRGYLTKLAPIHVIADSCTCLLQPHDKARGLRALIHRSTVIELKCRFCIGLSLKMAFPYRDGSHRGLAELPLHGNKDESALQEQKESLEFVLAQACAEREQLPRPQIVLVGATLPPEQVLDHYQQQVCFWGRRNFHPLVDDGRGLSVCWISNSMDQAVFGIPVHAFSCVA